MCWEKTVDGTHVVKKLSRERVSKERKFECLSMDEKHRMKAETRDKITTEEYEEYDKFLLAQNAAMFTLGMIIAPDGEAYGINRKKRARK
jgi:hypothetical protein